jgi:uncharacterized protein (TIGR03437 family)
VSFENKELYVSNQVIRSIRFGFVLGAAVSLLQAAPRLAISPQTAYTVPVITGQNGSPITVNAGNRGDGSLNLSVTSSVTWLSPSKGAQVPCTFGACTAINIALQTSSLAKGTYTGFVTVSDPNAVDSPQSISVTVQVGGSIPDSITFYAPPGGTASESFSTGGNPKITPSTSSGGGWLSVAMQSSGSFAFNVPYLVTATAGTLSASTYQGQLAISGSTFSPDNKNVPVTFTVTTEPIAQANPSSLTFTIAQGANKQTANLSLTNSGQGSLTVSGVTAATTSGGSTWLVTSNSGNIVGVAADPTGLSPGQYNGTVTIASNAANASVVVPVTLLVVAQTPPAAFAGGAVNNANFASGESLAQGDIVALFGSQFTTGDPTVTSGIPLPTSPNGTQVFVNGVAAPLYYLSPGQIDFQLPFEAKIGDGTVQVVRSGATGNNIFVNIAARVPRVYVITNPAGQLVSSAKPGDVLVIYGVGFGPTSPPVPTNTASPSNPPAALAGTTQVCFGGSSPFESSTCVNAQFVGLTPTFVGLYQVNVAIPLGVSGPSVPIVMALPDGSMTNQLLLNIQ